DGAVSVAGVAPGSVSAQRRSTEKKQPSATAAITVNSLFIQPISLRAVSLYSDPTGVARELPCRVARLTPKDVFCLALRRPQVRKSPVDSAGKPITKPCLQRGAIPRFALPSLIVTKTLGPICWSTLASVVLIGLKKS